MYVLQLLMSDWTDSFNVMLKKLQQKIWLDIHVIMHNVTNGPFLEMNWVLRLMTMTLNSSSVLAMPFSPGIIHSHAWVKSPTKIRFAQSVRAYDLILVPTLVLVDTRMQPRSNVKVDSKRIVWSSMLMVSQIILHSNSTGIRNEFELWFIMKKVEIGSLNSIRQQKHGAIHMQITMTLLALMTESLMLQLVSSQFLLTITTEKPSLKVSLCWHIRRSYLNI